MKRIIALLCVILFAFSLVACGSGDPETNYNKALEYLEKGEYQKAHRLLYELGDYKDAAEYLGKFRIYYKTAKVKAPAGTFKLDFKYDDFGNLIVSDSLEYEKEGPSVAENAYTYEFEYDEGGRITKRIDGGYNYTNYIYDSEGNLLKYEVCTYERTDKSKEPVLVKTEYLVHQDEYEYDENGKLIKETYYDSEGNVSSVSEYTYDSNGRIIKLISHNESDEITMNYAFEYDESGNLTKFMDGFNVTVYTYSSENVLFESTDSNGETGELYNKATYDANGNAIEYISYESDGSVRVTEKYTYDSFGKATEHTVYDSEGNIEQKEIFKYDKNGNLTEESDTRYSNDKETTVTTLYSNFVYFYYPDGIPEITGDDPYNYEYIDHYNLGYNPLSVWGIDLADYYNKQ